MKRRVLALLLLVLFVGLVGCAKTKVTDVFRFEVRELQLTLYADETKNLEKELGLIKGDIDENEPIVYTVTLLEGKDAGVISFYNEILEIIEVEPYISDSGIVEGTVISDSNTKVKIKALGEGSVRLTAFLKNSPNVTDSIIINVNKEMLSGIKVSAPNNAKYLYVGQSLQLSVSTFPENIESEYTFRSSNSLCATVDRKTGLVKAIAKPENDATIIITVTSLYDESITATYSFKILTEASTGVEAYKDSVKIGEEEVIEMTKGDEIQLSAKVLSELGLAPQNVTYKSSNTKVLTVTADGKVKAVGGGEANVTISSYDNKTCVVKFNVGYVASTSLEVKLNDQVVANEKLDVVVKQKYKFSAKVEPADKADQTVEIIVADEYKEFVTVKDLEITVEKAGEFKLTFTTKDSENPITLEVTFVATEEVASN